MPRKFCGIEETVTQIDSKVSVQCQVHFGWFLAKVIKLPKKDICSEYLLVDLFAHFILKHVFCALDCTYHHGSQWSNIPTVLLCSHCHTVATTVPCKLEAIYLYQNPLCGTERLHDKQVYLTKALILHSRIVLLSTQQLVIEK